MLAHFLALGDLIIGRVNAAMPSQFRLVAHAADLAGVKDSAQVTPGCHVLYVGSQPGAELRYSSAVVWQQDWLTVVVVRSAVLPKQLTGAVAQAGPLIGGLVRSLAGWQPADGVEPLMPVAPGVAPLITEVGTLYIPLRWRALIKQWT